MRVGVGHPKMFGMVSPQVKRRYTFFVIIGCNLMSIGQLPLINPKNINVWKYIKELLLYYIHWPCFSFLWNHLCDCHWSTSTGSGMPISSGDKFLWKDDYNNLMNNSRMSNHATFTISFLYRLESNNLLAPDFLGPESNPALIQ